MITTTTETKTIKSGFGANKRIVEVTDTTHRYEGAVTEVRILDEGTTKARAIIVVDGEDLPEELIGGYLLVEAVKGEGIESPLSWKGLVGLVVTGSWVMRGDKKVAHTLETVAVAA